MKARHSTPKGRRAAEALIAHRETAERARRGEATAADVERAKEKALRLLAAFVGMKADQKGARMRRAARCRSAR